MRVNRQWFIGGAAARGRTDGCLEVTREPRRYGGHEGDQAGALVFSVAWWFISLLDGVCPQYD